MAVTYTAYQCPHPGCDWTQQPDAITGWAITTRDERNEHKALVHRDFTQGRTLTRWDLRSRDIPHRHPTFPLAYELRAKGYVFSHGESRPVPCPTCQHDATTAYTASMGRPWLRLHVQYCNQCEWASATPHPHAEPAPATGSTAHMKRTLKAHAATLKSLDPTSLPARTRKAQPAMPHARIAQDEPMPPPTALPSLAAQAALWSVTEGLQDRIAYQDDHCVVLRFSRLPGKTVKAQIKAQGFRWTNTLTWTFGSLDAIPAEFISAERKVA